MKNSMIFTVFIPAIVITGIVSLLAKNGLISNHSGFVLIASIIFLFIYEILIRQFTKYQDSVEVKREKLMARIATLIEMAKHDDITPEVQLNYTEFSDKIETSLKLHPRSWLIYWLILDEQIKIADEEVTKLVKSCIDDMTAAYVARENIPNLLKSIPEKIESMEWISTPLIQNTRAYTYMCSAKDYYKKAVGLYESGISFNISEAYRLLEEADYCIDWANRICPYPEKTGFEKTDDSTLGPKSDREKSITERPNRGTKLV